MAERTPPNLSTDQVWGAIGRASNAVLGHVTPAGAPRTSGVVYRSIDRRIYVAVAPGTWKDRHIRADGRVAMTVLVRRGGLLSLLFPIPPATISFHGTATVHPASEPAMGTILEGAVPAASPEPPRVERDHRDHPRGQLPHLRDRGVAWRTARAAAGPNEGAGRLRAGAEAAPADASQARSASERSESPGQDCWVLGILLV